MQIHWPRLELSADVQRPFGPFQTGALPAFRRLVLSLVVVVSVLLPGFARELDCGKNSRFRNQEEGLFVWVHEGRTITLDCQGNVSSGSLSADWFYLDGRVDTLLPGERINVKQQLGLLLRDQPVLHITSQLLLRNTSMTDAGVYSCVIYNNHTVHDVIYYFVLIERMDVPLNNLHEDRLAGALQRAQRTPYLISSKASDFHYRHLHDGAKLTVLVLSCWSPTGLEAEWSYHGDVSLVNDSCDEYSGLSVRVNFVHHPQYANVSAMIGSSNFTLGLQRHLVAILYDERWENLASKDAILLSCHVSNHHGNKTQLREWLTRNFSIDPSSNAWLSPSDHDGQSMSMNTIQDGDVSSLQATCSSQSGRPYQYWAQWELGGRPVYRLAGSTAFSLSSLSVCQIGRNQQRLTVSTREMFGLNNKSTPQWIICKEHSETRAAVWACGRASVPTIHTATTTMHDKKDRGVRNEGLESDDIVAILIIALALLISVTTVIAVYKNRQRKVLIRRIRRRHRYLPSHTSDTNVSAIY